MLNLSRPILVTAAILAVPVILYALARVVARDAAAAQTEADHRPH